MADAYEVGIELALQDGVSAGLETVARELAALDAAVAASSAGLMALIRTAGMAAEAVAAVGGVRVRVPAAGSVEPREERPAEVPAGGTVRGEPRGGDSVAPQEIERVREEVVVPVAAPALPAGAAEERRVDAGAAVRAAPGVVERVPVVAPVMVVRQEGPGAAPERPASAARQERVEPVEAQRVAGGRAETAAPGRPGRDRGGLVPESPGPAVAAAPRSEAMAPVAERSVPAMRAEVARALPRRSEVAGPEPGRREPADAMRDVPGEARSGTAAPAPRREERGQQGSSALPVSRGERAVAPVRMSGGAGGGGGGTVLLDGRLVGEWLVERMARDAARPGAGMTSFDARQAPAWTPSGSV